jgi:hypothetical protein
MKASAKSFYAETLRQLSPKERLRLAKMILNDLTASGKVVDFSHKWTKQDIKDLTVFALSHGENPHELKKNPGAHLD